MIKRIIDISESAFVHTKHNQLLISREGEIIATIPIEDIGVLILQHPAIVVSQTLIINCQKNNVAIVFCDERYLPYSVVLPLVEANTLHTKYIREQIRVSQPIRKRLWQQVVSKKIGQQILTLEYFGKNSKNLLRIQQRVRSGDPDNCEAQAAKKYWRLLMGDDFRRDQNLSGVNALLNYGYAIVRAMIARAVVGAGLHPALGLHHSNQYNGLCLADDLMEPFRPWVDRYVAEVAFSNNTVEVNKKNKQKLLGLLSQKIQFQQKTMPLMVATHYLTANLKRIFSGSDESLDYPQLIVCE